METVDEIAKLAQYSFLPAFPLLVAALRLEVGQAMAHLVLALQDENCILIVSLI